MNFDLLVQSIADVHREMQARAVKAVIVGLTLRNWLIGAYISEYELRGEDRAAYGTALYERLAKTLKTRGLAGVNSRELPRFRKLYEAYPQILGSLTPEFEKLLPPDLQIHRTLTGESTGPHGLNILRPANVGGRGGERRIESFDVADLQDRAMAPGGID